MVQFNCGHWDIAHWLGGAFSLTSEGEYARNLQIIIDMISALFPHAKIVMATTTTMNPNGDNGGNPRSNEEISRYNGIIKSAAEKNNIFINDLYEVTKEWDSSYYRDYCHFTAASNAFLGQAVAATLKSYF
jgi:lysophospholipase L1-like esterase